MKQNNFFIGLLICLGLMFVFFSCNEKEIEYCELPPICGGGVERPLDCEEEEEGYEPPLDCTTKVIVDSDKYVNASDFRNISNLRIEGNCLTFTVNASGCDGSSWIVKLIGSNVRYSNPPQNILRVHFENNEDCTAVISREFSFNVEPLQMRGVNRVILWIAGQSILYEY